MPQAIVLAGVILAVAVAAAHCQQPCIDTSICSQHRVVPQGTAQDIDDQGRAKTASASARTAALAWQLVEEMSDEDITATICSCCCTANPCLQNCGCIMENCYETILGNFLGIMLFLKKLYEMPSA